MGNSLRNGGNTNNKKKYSNKHNFRLQNSKHSMLSTNLKIKFTNVYKCKQIKNLKFSALINCDKNSCERKKVSFGTRQLLHSIQLEIKKRLKTKTSPNDEHR